ncbi:MAG: hypothetical protein DME17_17085 [Candidatus Rokuibacteriota bacterium]|nr:MAG: hypothetical protein DME17_17085 [Candidatus Rokubacteria bacterium]
MEGHMRHVYVAVVVLALVLGGGVLGPSGAGAQTVGWQYFGGDPGDTHWSALDQVNTSNVSKLRPAWVLQLGTLRSQESTPIVIGDTLYVTSSFGPAHVFAVDARTGELRWRHDPEIAADVDPYGCCDVNNRGLAYANGKIFVGLLDGRLRALDARTGQMLWTSTVVDYKQGSVITSPPVVAKNNVVIGFGGGEYGARGALQAFNADTGALVWRTYLTPEPGEPGSETWKGDSWKTGGGAAWAIGSYDPEQNLIFYGTSNPGPWNASVRGPDKSDYGRFTNLYTSASVALDGDTGKIAWHYQSTPHDAWDYDGVNELLVADLTIDGQKTPVVLKGDRNGFLYGRRAWTCPRGARSRIPRCGRGRATGPRGSARPRSARRTGCRWPSIRRRASCSCPRSTSAWTWSSSPRTTSAAPSTWPPTSRSASPAPAASWARRSPGTRPGRRPCGGTRRRCPTSAGCWPPRAASCSTATPRDGSRPSTRRTASSSGSSSPARGSAPGR